MEDKNELPPKRGQQPDQNLGRCRPSEGHSDNRTRRYDPMSTLPKEKKSGANGRGGGTGQGKPERAS